MAQLNVEDLLAHADNIIDPPSEEIKEMASETSVYPPEEKPKPKRKRTVKPKFEKVETQEVEDKPLRDWKTEREDCIKGIVDGEVISKAKVISFAFTVWEKKNGSRIPVRYRKQPLEGIEKFVERAIDKGDKLREDIKIDTMICIDFDKKIDSLSFQNEVMVQVRPDQIESVIIGDSISLVARLTDKNSVYFEMES